MSPRFALSLRSFLGLAAATAFAPMAVAQGLLPWNGQVIAATGDPVPGIPGAVIGGSSNLDTGVLDDQGGIFFRGRMTGGGTIPLTERALFYGSSRENLQLVLQSGVLEPTGTVPGATLNTATGTGISGSNRIGGSGIMLFGATLYDGNVNVTATNDTLLYHGTPGNWQILVREGQAAPGTVGATINQTFSSPSQQSTGLNAAGRAFFIASLVGGDVVGTTNNSALYEGLPGALNLVVRKGQVAAGGEVVAGIGFVTQNNSSGQIAFDINFVIGSGTTPVTAANDRALWLYTPGVGVQQLVREGDAAPLAGATFNHPSNSWFVNSGSATFDGNGSILIRTDLQGPSITTGVNDYAIVRISSIGHTIIVQRGDAAPGVPGATLNVFNDVSCLQNDSGVVAFQGSLLGGGVTTADDTGTWLGTPGNWTLVVREGQAAPGTGGGTFDSPAGRNHMLNGAGQLLMTLNILLGSNPGSCLWSWDPIVGLQAQILSNEQIEVQTGVFKTFASQGGIQFTNGDTRALTFANDGTFTTKLNFSDSTGAIVKSRLGSLYAAPRTISTTSGGAQRLYLNAGSANAGNTYFVLGSVSGTAPGFHFGTHLVPLNPDTFTILTLTYPNVGPFGNTLGLLDAQGRALSTITIPAFSPGAGLTINWAYIALDALLNPTLASQSETLLAVL